MLCLNGFSQELDKRQFIDLKKIEAYILTENVEACNSYISEIEKTYNNQFSNEQSALLKLVKCKCNLVNQNTMSTDVCKSVELLSQNIKLDTRDGIIAFAEIQFFLAKIQIQENNFGSAIDRLEALLPKVEQHTNLNIKVLLNLAQIHESKFEYDTALHFLDEVQSLNKENEFVEYELTHELYNRYASVYSRKDNLEKTKEFIDMNLALVESLAVIDNLHLGNVHNTLAKYHFRNSDIAKALFHFEREFEYKSKVVDENKLSDCMMNIANMSSKMGSYDKALGFAQRSLEIIKNTYGQNSDRVAHNKFVTGLIFLEQRKYEEALQHFKEGLDIELELFGENNKGLSFNYIRLADCNFGIGNYELAIHYAQKAVAGFKLHFGEKNQQVSWAYETLIESAILQENYKLARKSIAEAYVSLDVELNKDDLSYESMRLPFLIVHILRLDFELSLIEYKVNQSETKLTYLHTLEKAAYGLYSHLKLNMGEGTMHRLLSIRLAGITEDIIAKNDFLYETTGDQKYLDEILKALEKGRNNVLVETKIENELVEYSGVPNVLIQKQIDIKDSIASLGLRLSTLDVELEKNEHTAVQNKINAFKESQIQLIETLKKDYKDFYALKYDYPVSSIEDIQEACGENENWLLFASSQNKLHLISITKSDVEYHKVTLDKKLRKDFALVKANLSKKNTEAGFYQASNNIYKLLLGELKLDKGIHLKVFPDGPLNGLPFEVLCSSLDGNAQTFLIEDHLISYHHSPYLSIHPHKGTESKRNALLLAPEFSGNTEPDLYAAIEMDSETLRGSLKSLKGAKEEVLKIASLMSSKSYVGDLASEKKFKEVAKSYNVLHIASHGFVNHKNPNYSKLVLSEGGQNEDGLLHSYEIYGLELNADLVTLSACNTGTGKEELGEGVSSLGRAFAFAGCPNSVMSLWSVNDQSTAKLMTYFYQNLEKGIPKAVALREAKLEFLEKQPQGLRAPFYWAGFVYYGDNLPLEIVKFNTAGLLTWGWWMIGLFGLISVLHFIKRKKQANASSV